MSANYKMVRNGNGTTLTIDEREYISVGKNGTGVNLRGREKILSFNTWDELINAIDPDKAWYFDRDISTDIEKAITDWRPELNRIADKLGRAELLAQLAEEASELSQAALKLRRVLDGRNPTPVTEESAVLHLQEELTDVLLCAVTVGVDKTEVERFIRAKSARWSARVEGDGDDV